MRKNKPLVTALLDSIKERIAQTHTTTRKRVMHYGLWAIGILFLYSLMGGTYSIPRIIRLNMEKQALIESNRQYTVELVDAARVRELLLSDPAYIEYIARTRYHMVRPNETIYRYRGR